MIEFNEKSSVYKEFIQTFEAETPDIGGTLTVSFLPEIPPEIPTPARNHINKIMDELAAEFWVSPAGPYRGITPLGMRGDSP